jgi:excisionase family DNA binding protein
MSQLAEASSDHWLDLSRAAEILGVHFTTLRRWADAGQVPCMRTPGGRRRFSERELLQFLRASHQSRSDVPAPLESATLAMARQQLRVGEGGHETLLAHFGEDDRARFRGSGQRLLGLLIQYGSRQDSGDAFLGDARRLAAEYGSECRRHGLSVTDTVRAFLFFGHSMLSAVQQACLPNEMVDEEGLRLYKRMSQFLDSVLLATVESYCQQPPQLED